MQSNPSAERNKKPIFWIILVVAALLAGALAIYAGLMGTRPAGNSTAVVARGKIPPVPPSPTMGSPSGPAAPSEAAPPGETSRLERDETGGPEEKTLVTTSETTTPPREVATADTGQEKVDPSEPTGSSDSRTPAAEAVTDDGRQDNTAGDQLQVMAPDSAPPSDSAASPPPDASATDAEPAQTTIRTGTPGAAALYTIQVGAYRKKSNADRQTAHLRKKGFDAYLYQRDDKDGQPWFFVRFGRFESFGSADQALAAFKEQERLDGSVLHMNSN